jgi:hypothetical protein
MSDEGAPPMDLRGRNQRVLRVILAVVAALILGSFMVGIRW